MGHLLNADIIEKMRNKLAIFIRKGDSAAGPQPAEGGYDWEEPVLEKAGMDAFVSEVYRSLNPRERFRSDLRLGILTQDHHGDGQEYNKGIRGL
jgi:hypothetical protein